MSLNFGETEAEQGFNIFPHAREYYQGMGKIRTGLNEVVVALDGSGDFDSIPEAILFLGNAGGTIYIKEGTYPAFDCNRSNIVFKGAGWKTIINTPCTATSKDNLFYENIYFLRNTGITNLYLTSCNSCKVIKCKFYSNGFDLLKFDNCENCSAEDNYFETGGDFSINFYNSTYCVARRNFLKSAQPITLEDGDYNVVADNLIKTPLVDGVHLFSGSCNNIISNNIIISPGQYGIFLEYGATAPGCDNNVITGNRIYTAGIAIEIDNAAHDNNVIVGNNIRNGSIHNLGTGTINTGNT